MSPIYRRLHKLRQLLGIFLLLLILVACRPISEMSFLPISQGGPFWQARGCKDVAVLLPATDEAVRWEQSDRPRLEEQIIGALPGVTIRYFNANGNAAWQEEQADIALEKGSCILVVGPSDSQKASEIVKKAKAKGVPTIAYDRLIQSEDLAFYVTFDSLKIGELQGQYIVDEFEKGLRGDYALRKGDRLVMINGAITDNTALQFYQGAKSKLQPLINNQDLNLIYDEYTSGWNNNEAAERVEQLIKTYDNIKVIYVANDGMAKAIINVLGELKDKVLVTGQDGEAGNIKNIVRGYQGMTVYKPSADLAIETAKVVKAFSEGTNIELLANNTVEINTDGKITSSISIPSFLAKPIFVDRTNLKETVVKDGVVSMEFLCNDPSAKYYKEVCLDD